MIPGSSPVRVTRRSFLAGLGLAPLILRPAPLHGIAWSAGLSPAANPAETSGDSLPFAEVRLSPHYPSPSPLTDLLSLVAPGSDSYITEKYAAELNAIFDSLAAALKRAPRDLTSFTALLAPGLESTQLSAPAETVLRSGFGIDAHRRSFRTDTVHGPDQWARQISAWLGADTTIALAEFEIFSIGVITESPLTIHASIRYDLLCQHPGNAQRQERIGTWQTEWRQSSSSTWQAIRWLASEEVVASASGPAFVDITALALGGIDSYRAQMLFSVDHWRTALDGATGIDIYSNNGIAAGDYDNDGFDDLYICQPAGLPNRLYRNRGDGTFEDVTEKAGVAVLDNSACALFADFDNRGLQDLLVVCGSGPLLFRNQGNGTFAEKKDAFQFTRPPSGTFTHAALADYDGDGRLDIYFCMYQYYLGLDQYHYPAPYYDARNGPPNSLLRNLGDGRFVEVTEQTGLNADNDRYSFACAWGDASGNGHPDLCVANDFGKTQLYRNNGNGTFTVVSGPAHIEDVGAGMSAAWSDYNNDGHQDIYISSMWEAAGQRVSEQKQFHSAAPESVRELYRRHARGNALYRNLGDQTFSNVGQTSSTDMGRWSWSADFWDLDHDGFPDLYVTNGYISAPDKADLASFFWRQVVARSPEDQTPSLAYERGWNAINELIRSDHSWNAWERNVLLANNRDGTFSEVSALLGLDCIEDSRSFALADMDHDGRLEVIVKNRNAPQLRVFKNQMQQIGDSIAVRLQGTKSNRDAIGAAITVECGALRQTRYLQAGSGFLAQHSKEMMIGLGHVTSPVRITVRWPGGATQQFESAPANHRILIVEGHSELQASPFASTDVKASPPAPAPAAPLKEESLETWLLEPLKAPGFTLPDHSGTSHTFGNTSTSPTLLVFWSAESEPAKLLLNQLQQQRSAITASGLQLLAINLDSDSNPLASARALATRAGFFFPVLFSTDEVAGVYNLIYRYLFDRRRDLPIPASFLLDASGHIVKLYQGEFSPDRLIEDLRSTAASAGDRQVRALPFPGRLFRDQFQRNDFTYGVAMFQHGYFDQAEQSFRQVILNKPDSADGYYNLGTLSLRRNNFNAAKDYLAKALALRPDYPEAWNNLGMLAAQQNNPAQAIDNFQQSIKLRPTYATALLNLGNVYRRLAAQDKSAYDKAADALNRALQLQPDNPEVNYSLGMLHAQQEQIPEALQFLKQAIALRPNYPEALNNLGVLYVHMEDYPRAEEQFQIAIRLAPDYDQSYLTLARFYAMRQQQDKARATIQSLLTRQPQNQAALRALQQLP